MTLAFRRAAIAGIVSIAANPSVVSWETCDVANVEGNGCLDSQLVSGLSPCGREQWNSVRPFFRLFAVGTESVHRALQTEHGSGGRD